MRQPFHLSPPDPEELAAKWLRIRRRFEAQAGQAVPPERRLELLDLTMEQFRVFSNLPLDGLFEGGPELERVAGFSPGAIEALLAKGLLERQPGPGRHRLCLTPLGMELRATLDRLQEETVRGILESLGPDLAGRMVQALEDFASRQAG